MDLKSINTTQLSGLTGNVLNVEQDARCQLMIVSSKIKEVMSLVENALAE